MSAFTEPLSQVREALNVLSQWTARISYREEQEDLGLAALERVERLATDMERDVEQLRAILHRIKEKAPINPSQETYWRMEMDSALHATKPVLSAREEGADTR